MTATVLIRSAHGASPTLTDITGVGDAITLVRCGRTELCSLYRSATALLTASHYESFNLPILEALSQGCPIVALESAVIPEFQASVLTAHSRDEFIQHMNRSITLKLDTKKMQEIRKKYSWEHIVHTIQTYYYL